MHALEQSPADEAAGRADQEPVQAKTSMHSGVTTQDAGTGGQQRAWALGFCAEVHHQLGDAAGIQRAEGVGIVDFNQPVVGLPEAAGKAESDFTIAVAPQECEVGDAEGGAMLQARRKAQAACQAVGQLS